MEKFFGDKFSVRIIKYSRSDEGGVRVAEEFCFCKLKQRIDCKEAILLRYEARRWKGEQIEETWVLLRILLFNDFIFGNFNLFILVPIDFRG